MKIDFTDPKTHKKMLYTFYGLFLIIFLYGVYFVYTDLYSVYLMKDEVTIDMGNSYQIELLPKNSGKFDYKNYRFKSKNNDVVEVNDHGEIVSLKEGEAVVTVVKDVEVNELDVENNFEVTVNDTKKLNIKINNVDNISTSLIFESKDKSIATVDSYGNITGIKEGNTYINVTSGNGITKNVKVTVKASNARIQEIVIDEKEINMYVGQTITVNAHLLPTSASSKDLWWVSSNPQVVSVDKKGNIKALKEGYSVIGVFASKDLNAQVTVYVSEEEIVLNKYNIELEVGSSDKITANIPVTYSSSDNSIVSIDENGKIKALKEGKVTITATHNNKKNTCVVVVKNKEVKEEKPTTIDVKSIELSESNITLTEGDTKSISVSVKPNNATNKKVNYKSENANVASVDSN